MSASAGAIPAGQPLAHCLPDSLGSASISRFDSADVAGRSCVQSLLLLVVSETYSVFRTPFTNGSVHDGREGYLAMAGDALQFQLQRS
jgi:hypothetical protein